MDMNTPETDKAERMAYSQEYMVDTEFARKLERERDEAREELHDIRLNLGEDADGYTLLHAVCVLQNKRDEARAALMRIEDLFLDGTDIYADRENMGLIAREALKETK